MVIGFQTIDVSVRNLTAGLHTIVVGGHLSGKTSSDEISWFRFAYIRIVASEPKRQRRFVNFLMLARRYFNS
jgi:hypothetical protein